MAKREELVVGLDIGTTKIAAVVGELTDEGIDVIGVGTHPSTGLKKGVVVHIDETVRSIQHAVEEAEHMAGVEITSVYAGIAGAHIKSLNSQGVWAVKEKEVRELFQNWKPGPEELLASGQWEGPVVVEGQEEFWKAIRQVRAFRVVVGPPPRLGPGRGAFSSVASSR